MDLSILTTEDRQIVEATLNGDRAYDIARVVGFTPGRVQHRLMAAMKTLRDGGQDVSTIEAAIAARRQANQP